MIHELMILIIEAIAVYVLVLGTHALRRRFGLAHFYALLGCITAIMSWVTDAGLTVQVGDVTFMVGSTVFYTSLLLGVFVIYVFDGPRATRVAISTVAGVSILVPLIAVVLHVQAGLASAPTAAYVPVPSLRINTASVLTTIADLVFLAVVWEFLGKPRRPLGLGLRAFITLLGVMWLDVLLFSTGAFAGTPGYVNIMSGTLVSRLIIAVFAWPFLYVYLRWQNRIVGTTIENRPVLAILQEVAEVRSELSLAQEEIQRRKAAEKRQRALEAELRDVQKLASVGTLAGGVAHNINNPVMGIINYAQLIVDDMGAESPAARYAVEIGHEADRIAEIVRTLMQFSGQMDAASSPVRAIDVVEATLMLVRSTIISTGIAIDVDIREDLPSIQGISSQLQQMMLNILINARDALGECPAEREDGKRIMISGKVVSSEQRRNERALRSAQSSPARCVYVPSSELYAQADEAGTDVHSDVLRITVEDNGPGISSEVIEHIFEPFFTTKNRVEHAGLGLSTSLGIVHEHGGTMTVETTAGCWTRFHVDLPVGDTVRI